MSFQKGWYTHNDVIKDLARATGRYVRGLDGYVLVGEQPPPNHLNLEDPEMQLLRLYGGCKPKEDIIDAKIGKPDLVGITQMLRMVDKLSEDPEARAGQQKTNETTTNTILHISKLNPDVAEFVPKHDVTNRAVDPIAEPVVDPVADVKSNKTDNCDIVNSLSDSRIDKAQLTPNEVKDMREKLKSKISVTSKATCYRSKRERNLAMATLLKLYCQPPENPPPVDAKPKLISPEYFEKPIDKSSNEKSENSSILVHDTAQAISASVDKVQKWLRDSEDAKSATKRSEVANASEENSDDKTRSKTIARAEATGAAQRSSPLYLGPVTFKRKASSKPMSPTSSGSVECRKTPKPTVFVPSKYATELTKTYMERSKK